MAADEKQSLDLIILTPINIALFLIKSPLLDTTDNCLFVKARVAVSQLTVEVHQFLQWLRGFMKDMAPGVKTLAFINLEDNLTSGRQILLRYLVP